MNTEATSAVTVNGQNTLPRPYYQDTAVTIYHGDCREIPTPSGVDLILSDPPYGCENDCDYTRFSGGRKPSRDFNGKNRPSGHHLGIMNDDNPFDPTPWLGFQSIILWGFQFYADKLPRGTILVWNKKRLNQLGAFLSDAELAWQKGGKGVYIFDHLWHGMDRQSERGDATLHPSQKPVSLMGWCITERAKLPVGGTVFDPFMGSGTTLRAAKDLGRKAIGIEIEESYCEIAAKRMEQEVMDFGASAICPSRTGEQTQALFSEENTIL